MKGEILPKHQQMKAMIISRNRLVILIFRKILKPDFKVRSVGLIELSKAIFLSSPAVRIVVLDFALQDKKGTNARLIKRVLKSGVEIYLLVLISHELQRKRVKELLGEAYAPERICLTSGLAKYIRGSIFLRNAKKKLLSSPSRK